MKQEIWGQMANGSRGVLFTLTNNNGTVLCVCDVGATVVSCRLPNGVDVIVGDKDSSFYPQTSPGAPYFGASIGRLAGRTSCYPIAQGEGVGRFSLSPNEGDAVHLHGGVEGLHAKKWHGYFVEDDEKTGVRLEYTSPHLESGYPGAIKVGATISLYKAEDSILIEYRAVLDEKTTFACPVNLTNHSYFSLGDELVLDNLLTIHSNQVYELDQLGLNTGALKSVMNTPFDFRSPKRISSTIDLLAGDRGGLDHLWYIDGNHGNYGNHGYGGREGAINTSPNEGDMTLVAVLESSDTSRSGMRLETYSTASSLVCYTGNFLDTYTQGERPYRKYEAICLEAQHAPGFLHNSTIPASMVYPGKEWRSFTKYKFVS